MRVRSLGREVGRANMNKRRKAKIDWISDTERINEDDFSFLNRTPAGATRTKEIA